jgi:rhodanese-related sulfurtransferase
MKRIEPRELNAERQRGGVMVLDLRSEKAFASATEHIPGDVRYSPADLEAWGSGLPRDQHLVAYCT